MRGLWLVLQLKTNIKKEERIRRATDEDDAVIVFSQVKKVFFSCSVVHFTLLCDFKLSRELIIKNNKFFPRMIQYDF